MVLKQECMLCAAEDFYKPLEYIIPWEECEIHSYQKYAPDQKVLALLKKFDPPPGEDKNESDSNFR